MNSFVGRTTQHTRSTRFPLEVNRMRYVTRGSVDPWAAWPEISADHEISVRSLWVLRIMS